MKTAISLPDDTFERVDRHAKERHMSRSELFTLAVVAYLDRIEEDDLTGRYDEALARGGADAARDAAEVAAVGAAKLSELTADDEW